MKPLPPPSPTRESCGSCNACCRSFEIPVLNKPAGVWCPHVVLGKGCGIYETRPGICRKFQCLWLMSHTDQQKTPMPMAIRPDKSHVLFGALSINGRVDEMATTARVEPGYPGAWRKWPVGAMINQMVDQGVTVVVYDRGTRTLLERGQPPRDIGPEPE